MSSCIGSRSPLVRWPDNRGGAVVAVVVVLLLSVEVGISLLIGRAAERKNRSRWSWFFISLLVSPVFAAIAIACMARPGHRSGVGAPNPGPFPLAPPARPLGGGVTEFGSWVQACLNPDCSLDHVALPIPSPRCPACGAH